jgi:hypothetical protein
MADMTNKEKASTEEVEAMRRVVRFLLAYYRAMAKQRAVKDKDKEVCI